MTIAELYANEELRRHEFPVTTRGVFLGHAAVCPLPRRVAEACAGHAHAATLGDQEEILPAGRIMATRQLAARLIGATPAEIALVGPTSLGLSYIAAGLSYRRGDNILVYHDDYPSNVYPWMALAERGVKVRLLNVRDLGRIRPIDIMGQVDESTRLVALASAHFVSGWRIDLAAIGSFLRARNILFCLDAIQTLGAFQVNVEHVDFLAADAHKWLLGPCGAGILYVRHALQEHVRPPVYGWHNVRSPNFIAQEQIVYPPDARRFEAGSHSLLGVEGLHAALELILEVGVDAIATELRRKRGWLVSALGQRGWQVLCADATGENLSGIVSFSRPDADMTAVHARLAGAGVTASLRGDRAGRKYLRFSPHFYNTDDELQRAVEALG